MKNSDTPVPINKLIGKNSIKKKGIEMKLMSLN